MGVYFNIFEERGRISLTEKPWSLKVMNNNNMNNNELRIYLLKWSRHLYSPCRFIFIEFYLYMYISRDAGFDSNDDDTGINILSLLVSKYTPTSALHPCLYPFRLSKE